MLSIFRQRRCSAINQNVNKYRLLLGNKVCVLKKYVLKQRVKNYFHIMINFDFDIMVINHEVNSLLNHNESFSSCFCDN